MTVRRTSLVYSADALEPVTFPDEPHPMDAPVDRRLGEPTVADLRRQLADVNTSIRLAKDGARALSLAGLHLSEEDSHKHSRYMDQLKAAQWRLTKTLAELDGAADVASGRLSRSIAGHG